MLATSRVRVSAKVACARPKAGTATLRIERLLDMVPEHDLYRYRMESSAMPVRDYTEELWIEDNDDGTSTIV
jgi:hypothetical protein